MPKKSTTKVQIQKGMEELLADSPLTVERINKLQKLLAAIRRQKSPTKEKPK